MSAPSNRVLGSTLYGAELTKKDLLSCYQDLEWLNDEVINGHLALTVDYLREKANNTGRNVRPKYFALSTFFYPKLRDGGYKGVSRWARRGKIEGEHLLDVETVFVPVHQQSHWTLLVVSPANKTIEYFDSLGSRWRSFVDTIKEWLEGELGEKYVEDEWTVLRTPSPRQDNGSDCGVFLLTTAKAVALGLEPTAYGPGDVPLLRKKIVAELLNSGFRGDLDPSGPGPARL
jgi:Ulp1 family protease